MRILPLLLACTAIAAAPAAAQQQTNAAPVDGPTRTFTGADLFGLSIAADPQISPDGRTIVYVRRTGDIMSDRMQSSLWLIDVASGKQSPFATSGSSPRWSPDGTRIAYVAADGDRAQLFVRWVATGASTRVTSLPGDPNSLAWSPDGKRLAYVSFETQKPIVYVHDLASGQRKAVAPPKSWATTSGLARPQ